VSAGIGRLEPVLYCIGVASGGPGILAAQPRRVGVGRVWRGQKVPGGPEGFPSQRCASTGPVVRPTGSPGPAGGVGRAPSGSRPKAGNRKTIGRGRWGPPAFFHETGV